MQTYLTLDNYMYSTLSGVCDRVCDVCRVVFNEVIQTSKHYMRDVTVVSGWNSPSTHTPSVWVRV